MPNREFRLKYALDPEESADLISLTLILDDEHNFSGDVRTVLDLKKQVLTIAAKLELAADIYEKSDLSQDDLSEALALVRGAAGWNEQVTFDTLRYTNRRKYMEPEHPVEQHAHAVILQSLGEIQDRLQTFAVDLAEVRHHAFSHAPVEDVTDLTVLDNPMPPAQLHERCMDIFDRITSIVPMKRVDDLLGLDAKAPTP